MALRRFAAPSVCLSLAAALLSGTPAHAQSLTEEVSVTAGGSTDNVGAVGTQVRLFGDLGAQWQVYVEGAWATRTAGVETDAFGAAYPYDNRVRVTEAYVDRTAQRRGWLASLRAGRYRTPFGISGRSDHAYTGFLRAPLIRYDDYFGLSNNFLEGGVDVIAGTPGVNVEVSLGVPQDIGHAVRRSGLDRVVRVQASRGSLLVGASHIRSKPFDRRSFVRGNLVFTGVDVRWMLNGVQLRGEWITGTPFNGVPDRSTTGWYIDAIVHRPAMGPLTLVGRGEDLRYEAGVFSSYGRRYTAGARVQILNAVVLHLNVYHQPFGLADTRRNGLDVGATFVFRHPQ